MSPPQGKFLHLLARSHGARSILEIGTLGGYSTIWLARALPPGGRLVTLEYEPKHAEVARANIARAGLADMVEIRIGPALETLPQLAAEGRGPFDLIFIDADKEGYPRVSRLGPEAFPPRQPDHRRQCGAARGRDRSRPTSRQVCLPSGVSTKNSPTIPRLMATALQVVGSKGHDGLAMALVIG